MTKYASGTSVSVEKSRAEIEHSLRRYGATAFAYGWDDDESHAMVQFRIGERTVRMSLPYPDRNAREFTHTPQGWARTTLQAAAAYDQAIRSRWRALGMIVKAKLEAVESGISTVEREFLADVVVAGGKTLHEFVAPQLYEAARRGISEPRILRLDEAASR